MIEIGVEPPLEALLKPSLSLSEEDSGLRVVSDSDGEEVARAAIGVVLFREMLIPEGPVVDCEDGRGASGLEVRAPGEVESESEARESKEC